MSDFFDKEPQAEKKARWKRIVDWLRIQVYMGPMDPNEKAPLDKKMMTNTGMANEIFIYLCEYSFMHSSLFLTDAIIAGIDT